ncbi:MAG: phytanoyl-CoA dioxygenase family protein [Parcubacteria group bacterium]|nr:phytanoyl-CoA dioxygenase family protein [Parcubacteria group bacterium]
MNEFSDKQIKKFQKEGFLDLGQLFSVEETIRVRTVFDSLVSTNPKGVKVIYETGSREEEEKVVRSIMGWQRVVGVLESFAKDKRVLDIVEIVLGSEVEFHQTKYNPKAPSGKSKKWDPHRGDTFWCLKDGISDPEGILTVFVALTDQTEDNGAVIVWKGSQSISLEKIKKNILGLDSGVDVSQDTAEYLSLQLDEEIQEEINARFEKVVLEGVAGTVWLIHSGLLHSSRPNMSSEQRDLVANVFRRTDNRPSRPRAEEYLSEPENGPL